MGCFLAPGARRNYTMRLFGPGSVSTLARFLLDALLVVAVILVALDLLGVAALLVNPLRPVRHYIQVTTQAAVLGSHPWPSS